MPTIAPHRQHPEKGAQHVFSLRHPGDRFDVHGVHREDRRREERPVTSQRSTGVIVASLLVPLLVLFAGGLLIGAWIQPVNYWRKFFAFRCGVCFIHFKNTGSFPVTGMGAEITACPFH